MSSHHFVKEGQEPALIIANGAPCHRDILDQLLEWNPYVIALDGAAKRVLELGIKIDAVLGDFDSIGNYLADMQNQMPLDIISAHDQNKTDLQKAIEYLAAKKYLDVNIVWATGWRSDHVLSNIFDIARYKHIINCVMIDDHSRIFSIPNRFSKWYPKGQLLSIIPAHHAQGIYTSGLAFNLNNEELSIGSRLGTSNYTSQDGMVEITYQSGNLLLIESTD
jgi:thiamine pyrophosphokinase